VEALLSYLKQQRLDSDNSFDKYVIEASRLASEIDVVSVFEQSAGRIKARRVLVLKDNLITKT